MSYFLGKIFVILLIVSLASPIFASTADSSLKSQAKSCCPIGYNNQINFQNSKMNFDSISSIVSELKKEVQALKQRKLEIVRIQPVDLVGKIKLHQQDKTFTPYIEVPKNTVGLLIQISYYHAATNNNSHGYLDAQILQKGDTKNFVKFHSTKFNWYANTVSETEIVPWSSQLAPALEIKLSGTYNTQSNNPYEQNYYEIKLVGYLMN